MTFVERTNFPTLARPEAHQHHGSELVKGSITADQLATASVTGAKLASEAWSTWVPTLTSLTLGNGTVTAKYQRVGRAIHYYFKFVLGSTSAVGTNPFFTLPATAANAVAQEDVYGHGKLRDVGNADYPAQGWCQNSTTVRIVTWGSAATYVNGVEITATVPFTWATGDSIVIEGTYEAAS